jgi:hypothetical protein
MSGGGGNRRDHDYYPTPWEATVALLKEVTLPCNVWEPACGDGAMAEVLRAYGHYVTASDIVARGYGVTKDFLAPDNEPFDGAIVTNPPFKLAGLFIEQAVRLGAPVAMLLKVAFWNASSRLKIFDACKPSRVLPLTWRLDFTGGGAPTMDCMWCVWGAEGEPYKPLPKPSLDDHPVLR